MIVDKEKLKKAVNKVLRGGIWPIYRTDDDRGLEKAEYIEFIEEVLAEIDMRKC